MRMLAGNTQRTTPAPDRLTFVVGRPTTIALKYATGKPTRYGRVMYSLTDGRTAFFEPEVAAQIDALRLAPGQPFTVCNYGVRGWDVKYERTSDSATGVQLAASSRPGAPEARPAAPPMPPPPSEMPPISPWPLDAASQDGPRSRVNGAGEDAAAILTRCYAQAIVLQVAALDQARAKGLHLTPTFEALQACAATLFIAETRRLQQ